MGFRGAIRKGGGFLNGVVGTIVDTKVETFESKKGDEMVSFRLFVKPDGADQPVDTSLFFGGLEGHTVSDDERSLASESGDPIRIGANTGLGVFMETLLDIAPELENRLPDLDAGAALTLTGLHGTRLEFRQQVNEEATKKRGKRKGKNGKEYAQTDLVVERVLEMPQAASKSNGKAAKPAGKPAAGKGAAKAAPAGGDVAELAETTLVEILKAQDDNTIPKQKVRMKVFSLFGAKHPQRAQRDDVVKTIYDDAFLAGLVESGVIEYAPESEEQLIALA